jgi:hypothetical protein
MSAAAEPITLRNAQPELHDAVGWIDARVRDALGKRLGRVSAVFADREGQPWWIVVRRRGRTLVAPVAAVQSAGHSEVLLTCTQDVLVPAEEVQMSDAFHESLITRFGLDRRQQGPRTRGDCTPPRERRRRGR